MLSFSSSALTDRRPGDTSSVMFSLRLCIPPSKMTLPLPRVQLECLRRLCISGDGWRLHCPSLVLNSSQEEPELRPPPPQARNWFWEWRYLLRVIGGREQIWLVSGMNNSTDEREPFSLFPPEIKIPSLSTDLSLLFAALFSRSTDLFSILAPLFWQMAMVMIVTAIMMMIDVVPQSIL